LAVPVSRAQALQPALLNVVAKTSSSTRIQTSVFPAYRQVEVVEDEAVEAEDFPEAELEQRD
jgi:hypothetical protein